MRFATAVLVSLFLHGVLAAALCVYMRFAPEPTVRAELDLSSVDLSFAEREDMSEAAVALPPAASEPPPPRPNDAPPPESELRQLDDPLPPEPAEIDMPVQEAETREMKPETVPESERQEAKDAPAPRQAKIDAPPKPLKAIRPDYPKAARQRGEQGDVVLEIRVNAAGRVDSVAVVSSSGSAELDAAAVRAAKDARFSPAKSGGDAVGSTARLTLTFRLR